MSQKRDIAVLVFEGFETLDVMGPIELFGMHPDAFAIHFVASTPGNVASVHRLQVVATEGFESERHFDLVLVPGGIGTRQAIKDEVLLDWIRNRAADAEILTSVCTGSALLAMAGVLDGRRATTNKMAFSWVTEQGPKVNWIARARWVEDGDVFTSSGVSAGMDMTLAVIARLLGQKAAEDAALWAEYTWHRDADHDPFAETWGLTG